MKRIQKFGPSLLALAGAVAFAVPVQSARAEEGGVIIEEKRPATAVEYHYIYYPDAEVYFVPEKKVYYYLEGEKWVSAPKPPSGVVLVEKEKVRLDVDQPEPWTYHEKIVEKYGGKHHKVKIKEKTEEKETIKEKEKD
jgi:hypothetical protein